jgi:DNA-binding XRE family transcriptional regulator
MANLQQAMRGEISRLARKELRTDLQSLHKIVSAQRSFIAQLRRRVDSLERALKAVAKQKKAVQSATSSGDIDGDRQLRFRAGGFATLRQKLGLSAKDMGTLVGVSGLTIYKWEKGETRPRAKQLPAIAAVRGLGKREAKERLAALDTTTEAPRKRRARSKK